MNTKTEKLICIYTTDAWHTRASRTPIAIADNKQIALSLIISYIETTKGEPLSEDDIYNINNIYQTQGYAGEVEFLLSAININTLI